MCPLPEKMGENVDFNSESEVSETDSCPPLSDINERSEEQPIVIENDDEDEQTPFASPQLQPLPVNKIKAVTTGGKTVFHVAPGCFDHKKLENTLNTVLNSKMQLKCLDIVTVKAVTDVEAEGAVTAAKN